MNTKDHKIQWHPAFDAALQIELREETKYLILPDEPFAEESKIWWRNPGVC